MENMAAVFQPWMRVFYPSLFALVFLLYFFNRDSKKRTGAAALLALCSLAGVLITGLMGAERGVGGLVKLGFILSQLLAAVAAINVSGTIIFSMVLTRLGASIPKLLQDLILAVAYVAGGLAVISASGADLSGIIATSAVVTGVVAFSLQDTLGNVIGGTVLHLENAFRPGDWIAVEGMEGVVREIRWRQTTIENLDGDLVIIPNITLMKGAVTVMGRAAGNTRFRAVSFNVYYAEAPGDIITAVNRALADDRPAGVAASPAPYCAIKEFQPNCVVYELRYYLSDLSSPGRVDSDLRLRVYYALSRAGIKLSIPVRSVVINEDAQEVAEKSVKGEQARRLAALKGVDLLEPLTEGERELLAHRLKPTPFTAGESITRQGAVADWLYLIYAGRAEVRLSSESDEAFRVVKTLAAGDIVGEMGLLTGEPRSATVVAAGETRCYRLDRESFAGILSSRPEIAGSLALILAKRRMELAAVKEKLDVDAAARGLKTEQQDLLSKIKEFFKL